MERRGLGGHQACNVDTDILLAAWLKHSHVLTGGGPCDGCGRGMATRICCWNLPVCQLLPMVGRLRRRQIKVWARPRDACLDPCHLDTSHQSLISERL